MKSFTTVLRWIPIVIAFGLVAPPAAAQARTGEIRGRVTADETGGNLPGAQVVLEGTGHATQVDRSGRYRLQRVPAGTYGLLVRYIGYVAFRTQVTVAPGAVVEQDAALKLTAVTLAPLEVTLQTGQAKALNAQKNAATITNVVDREQIEAFPDYNTADALQRVPGVSISRSFGEGKFVAIRGTEPRLTSVTVDGQKLATPEDEERFVALDVISSNQLAGLEVTKALTPEMDADAIGGTVNLVSRSAFDLPSGQRELRFTGGYGRADLGDRPLYDLAGSYSQLLGGDRLALSVNGTFRETSQITHNNESQWGEETTQDGVPIPFALRETQFYRYNNERQRLGAGADLEYRPSPTSRYFLRGMFNQRDDYQNRQGERFRVDRGDYLSATQVAGASVVRALQDRTETQYITNVAAGGSQRFGAWKVDLTGAYTYGEQNKDGGQILPEFQLNSDVDLNINLSDPEHPGFAVTNQDPAYLNDPANYELDVLDFRFEKTTDQERIGALDIGRSFTLGRNAGTVQFGGKARQKSKDRHDQRWRYGWTGADAVMMTQFASDAFEEPFFDGRYTFGPTMDQTRVRRFLAANRGTNLEEEVRVEDSIGDAYEAGEDIYSGYAMGSVTFGRLMVLAGVRNEYTRTDYEGTRLNLVDDQYEIQPVSDARSYNFVFPALHLRFAATDRTNLRFAFTSGIARPNFFDLVPYLWISNEDLAITRGNSALDPTQSWNFDVMAEHYFSSIGVLSAGVFYKSLRNIIYDRIHTETAGTYAGFEITEPVNGGDAKLYGIEANWQQQLSFLPGPLAGLGIYANYTYSESEANLLFREWTTLPGQAGDVGNVALSYDRYGITARVSMNYSGELLSRVGETPAEDFITQSSTQWDFSSSVDVGYGASLYLNLINFQRAAARVSRRRPLAPAHHRVLRLDHQLRRHADPPLTGPRR
jgi:TonB-dependent receptor